MDDVDGVILALGRRGMESVVSSSPDLARLPVFSSAASHKGIDVISCRIWFGKVVETRTPAHVFSKFEALRRGAGGTFFMLNQLQGDAPELLGETEGECDEDEEATRRGSVVACNFYNSGGLMSRGASTEVSAQTFKEDFTDARICPSFACLAHN